MSRRTWPSRLAVAVLVLGASTGCSGGKRSGETPNAEGGEATSTTDSAPAAAEPVPTKVLLGQVVGQLPGPRRRALLAQVTPVVDGWLDAAYVGGTWPREISDAYPGFTAEAARQARRDQELTSNAEVSERIDGLAVTNRAVRFDVLAAGRRPVGVTARIALDYKTTGEVVSKVSVRGRLRLTQVRDHWRVFAYDLTKGER